MNGNHIPLALGRIKQVNGRFLLTGSLGHSTYLTEHEARLVDAMEGFMSVAELAQQYAAKPETVASLADRLTQQGLVTELSDWNKLRWCPACLSYLVTEACTCPHCNTQTDAVPLSVPCDIWILLGEDFRFIQESLRQVFQRELPDEALLLGNWGLLDNRSFWEIIYQGKKILTVHFDGERRTDWRYIPTEDLSRVDFERPVTSLHSQIEDLIELNAQRLRDLEQQSMAVIEETYDVFPSLPLIYFSGGKESMVMAEMFRQLQIKCNLLLVLAGMDQPDDVAFFKETLVPYLEAIPFFHLHVYAQDPEMFFTLAGQKGALSAKDPWCRKDLKMPLKHRATRALYGDAYFVAYEGSRKYETNYRRRFGTVNFPANYPNQLWVHPNGHWTGLDLWLYIFKNQLQISPVYFKGFQKTTCWCCPLVQPFHLECSKREYPELWSQLGALDLIGFGDRDSPYIPY